MRILSKPTSKVISFTQRSNVLPFSLDVNNTISNEIHLISKRPFFDDDVTREKDVKRQWVCDQRNEICTTLFQEWNGFDQITTVMVDNILIMKRKKSRLKKKSNQT